MIFFDDEMRNINDLRDFGVRSFYIENDLPFNVFKQEFEQFFEVKLEMGFIFSNVLKDDESNEPLKYRLGLNDNEIVNPNSDKTNLYLINKGSALFKAIKKYF